MVKTYEIVKEDLDDNFAGNYKEWYKQLTPEDKLEIDGSIFTRLWDEWCTNRIEEQTKEAGLG